jgi:hypothetical protein
LANASTDGLTLVVLTGESEDDPTPNFTAGDLNFAFDLTGGVVDSNGFLLLHNDGTAASVDPGDMEASFDFFGSPSTFLLVEGFTGSTGTDLDTDDDGTLDVTPWTAVVDAISLDDNDGDTVPTHNYATTVSATTGGAVVSSTDGFTPAAVSRLPDGTGAFVLTAGADTFTDDSNDTPGLSNEPVLVVTETGGGTGVLEGSGSDSFDVALTKAPSTDVTITLATSGQANLSTNTLTFTPANWSTAQTVTVTAADDGVTEGLHSDSVSFLIASSDTAFDGAGIPDLPVTIADVVVTATSIKLNEVRISSSGSSDDFSNFVEVVDSNGTAGVDLSGLTIVAISEGSSIGQINDVLPLDGGVTDANGFTLIHSDGTSAALDAGDLEFAGLDFLGAPTTFLLVSGFTGSVGQDLDSNDDRTLDGTPWTTVYDGVTLDALGGVATGFGLSTVVESNVDDTFTAAGVRRFVDAVGSYGVLSFDDISTFDSPGQTNALPANVRVTPGSLNLNEATTEDFQGNIGVTTGEFEVVLDSQPTSPVTVTVTADSQLTVDGGSSVTLTFDASNWTTPQRIELVAVDDADQEGDHTGLVSLAVSSSDTDYNEFSVNNVVADIVDNENADSVVVINEILYDPGLQEDANGDGTVDPVDDEFIEVLNTGNTPVDISGWTLSDAVQVRHTFPAGTVLVAGQAIVVFGGGTLGTYGNSRSDTASTGDLNLSNSGDTVTLASPTQNIDRYSYQADEVNDESLARDTNFAGEDGYGPFIATSSFGQGLFSTPGLTNYDGMLFDIGASVAVVETDGSTEVDEEGATSDTFTVALTAQPSANVTITVSASDGETTLDVSSLVFTTGNWATPQTVTVTAVDDADIEGTHSGLVTFVVTSTDGDYEAFSVPAIDVAIVDNDVPSTTNALINEFVADHTGADSDAFVEIFAPGVSVETDLSSLWLLEIEGGTAFGNIDEAIQLGTTDAAGYWVQALDAENDTVTFLLVEDFTGAVNDDLDTNDDGVFDVTPWASLVDSVATVEDPVNHIAYSDVLLTPGLDGDNFQYGGASRIPNGTDTDTTADWVRNNYSGAGFASFPSATPNVGEALNTPGAANQTAVASPGVTIDELDGVSVGEEGPTSDTFTVVLDSQPSADVTVALTITDGQTTTDVASVTFTSLNWDSPQTVTVTAVDDAIVEGGHTGNIELSVTSSDADYSSLTLSDLSVSIADDDGVSTTDALINEFVANHTGSDTEAFVEIFAPNATGATNLSSLWLLEVDGDSTAIGEIKHAQQLGATDANGYFVDSFDPQNGSMTLLLVENYTGSSSTDLDSDDDGVIDTPLWDSIIDSVSINDGGTGDVHYSGTVLDAAFDGGSFTVGGASRIPNGTDTDTSADWVRNAFNGAGFAAFSGATAATGEALNTPGAVNEVEGATGTPPSVESIVINDGSSQRSQITSLTITFDSEVDHTDLQSAFLLTNIDSSLQLPAGSLIINATDAGGKTTAVITFASGASVVDRAGTGALGHSLADGNYQLDVSAAFVNSASGGVAMLADYVFGGQVKADSNNDDFFRLYGDSDGDGDNDFSDLNNVMSPALFKAEGDAGYEAFLDADGDGDVDFTDLNNFYSPNLFVNRS